MDPFLNNRVGPSASFAPPSGASAPPPPSEIKVRTMKSDLASMAKSGGGVPQFQNVKVDTLSISTAKSPAAGILASGTPTAPAKKSSMLGLILVIALLVLGAIGYFGYETVWPTIQQDFFGQTAQNPGNGLNGVASNGTPAPSVTPEPSPTPIPSPTPFTHVSAFALKPADQVLTLAINVIGGGATSAADLETFNQKLTALLATAKKTSSLVEVDVKDAAGNDVDIANILREQNASVLGAATLANNFSADATFFVYKDANGSWPGYVIPLQAGKDPSVLGNQISELESSPAIANLFLNNPGPGSSDGFTDSTVGSNGVRILPFLNATPPSFFVYGWYNNNLILSTSENGFAAALARI